MKTIGLLGGMSWESTIPYYRLINEGIKTHLGGLHSASLLLHSVDFHEIEACQSSGEWDKAGEILADAALGLFLVVDGMGGHLHGEVAAALVRDIVVELVSRGHGLVEAIKTLPERDQLVMSLYYEQELNLKEIGAVLNVTESRVCQLHSQAVARLRTKLKAWIG